MTTAAAPVLTSASPGTAGQPVTVTDSVSAASGPTPTGTENFTQSIGGVATAIASCQGEALNAGVATCSFTPFAGTTGGTVLVTAAYTGSTTDAYSAASASLSVLVYGTNPFTTFTLATSANPDPSGRVVVLTATVAGSNGNPTGMMTFSDDGNPVVCTGNTSPPVKVSGGVASCKETPSGAGRPHHLGQLRR